MGCQNYLSSARTHFTHTIACPQSTTVSVGPSMVGVCVVREQRPDTSLHVTIDRKQKISLECVLRKSAILRIGRPKIQTSEEPPHLVHAISENRSTYKCASEGKCEGLCRHIVHSHPTKHTNEMRASPLCLLRPDD